MIAFLQTKVLRDYNSYKGLFFFSPLDLDVELIGTRNTSGTSSASATNVDEFDVFEDIEDRQWKWCKW